MAIVNLTPRPLAMATNRRWGTATCNDANPEQHGREKRTDDVPVYALARHHCGRNSSRQLCSQACQDYYAWPTTPGTAALAPDSISASRCAASASHASSRFRSWS